MPTEFLQVFGGYIDSLLGCKCVCQMASRIINSSILAFDYGKLRVLRLSNARYRNLTAFTTEIDWSSYLRECTLMTP